ncbi:hypothetical protein PGTUg99_032987 [Puccinia graminis f. sp. tritici]|uniref:Uncharacterized protein n=1 Tax=Puccinia graminis f. sp. tritici TaxID=56615 RepID=A0A5B0P664_PUCGR|nr:hypothetical protein PGTUg99_032987 [Puccinia graminis f. sp. tritici]
MELKIVSPADIEKDVRTSVKVKQHVITQGAAQLASGPLSLVSAEEFNVKNVYMNQIYDTHLPNVKYKDKMLVYLHSTDSSRYIPLTNANVQKWAAALMKPNNPSSINSPPPKPKYKKLSSVKNCKLNDCSSRHCSRSLEENPDSSSVVDPGVNLLDLYLEFVKIPSDDRRCIFYGELFNKIPVDALNTEQDAIGIIQLLTDFIEKQTWFGLDQVNDEPKFIIVGTKWLAMGLVCLWIPEDMLSLFVEFYPSIK